jgi:iron(III) transport system permease protein
MNKEKGRQGFNRTRLKNQLIDLFTNPFNVIVIITLIILFCLVIIPLLQMISSTFLLAKSEQRRVHQEVGSLTLYYWKYMMFGKLSAANFWIPLRNSVVIGLFTVLISVPLGSIIAWLVVRSDIPGKHLIGTLVVVPYMIPSWCKAISWLAIFRNQRSGSLGLLAGLGMHVPDWLAYGPIAIVLCMSMHYYAFAYINVSSALRTVNSELEEMGEICGAPKSMIIRKITLPLVIPSILSSIIMTLSKAIGAYGVAANLGTRIGYYTLATKMKVFINDGPKGVGYAMSIVLIAIAALIIFGNQKIIGVRKSYATIGGKGGRTNDMKLGKAKFPLMTFIVVFLFLAMVMPMFVLVMETFQKVTGNGYGLSNLTMYNWIGTVDQAQRYTNYPGIFHDSNFGLAFFNTIKLTAIGSIITAICGQFLGYISTRGRGKWYGSLTEQLVYLPFLMPGVAFSAMYFSMFSVRHWFIPSLYGTFSMILVTTVVKHFPFASRSGTANMMQISTELEESATLNGAGFWRRMRKIVLPLAKNGFISGFMLTFISVAKELDLIIIMMTPKNQTLSYLAFTFSQEGYNQQADAISVVTLLFILVCYIVAGKFGADLGKSW